MNTPRHPSALIRPIAETIVARLKNSCQRIDIAGSLRRQVETAKDIEIVCQPILEEQRDLFQQVIGYRSRLDSALSSLINEGLLEPAGKDGQRYKNFKVLTEPFPHLDLFIVRPPAQYGVILAIRTGPAEFSRRLVTPRNMGGLLPSHLVVRRGAIYHGRPEEGQTPSFKIDTEHQLFDILEIAWIPPEKRQ